MRAMLGILLVATPAAAEPLFGARVGAHETQEDGQASFAPLAEIEGGVRWHDVALTGLVRVDWRSRVDTGTHSCAEAGPESLHQCPWAATTAQTDVALGVRARVRVEPRLWIAATVGAMRDFESISCSGNSDGCNALPTDGSYDGVFGETSVAYAVPVRGLTIELMLELGYAYLDGSSYSYNTSTNARWIGLSLGVRR